MPEDEYDFEGLNPGKLFAIDEQAESFDYEAQLQQKELTHNSPPDLGGLFKALATKYPPSIVVNLPPKVVERLSWRDRLSTLRDWCASFFIIFLWCAVIVSAILVPYWTLVRFEMKLHMQASALCTITSEQIYDTSVGSDPQYIPSIYVTLHAPNNGDYDIRENDPHSYVDTDDAQAYLSQYKINHIYPCWYNPANPTQVTLVKGVSLSDYIELFAQACLFLLCGVLPLALLILLIRSLISERRQQRRT